MYIMYYVYIYLHIDLYVYIYIDAQYQYAHIRIYIYIYTPMVIDTLHWILPSLRRRLAQVLQVALETVRTLEQVLLSQEEALSSPWIQSNRFLHGVFRDPQ